MPSVSYEGEFLLHESFLVGKTHLHVDGFARGLAFKQRQDGLLSISFFAKKRVAYVIVYINFFLFN